MIEGKITQLEYNYTIDDVYGDAIVKKNAKGVEYENDYKITITKGKIKVEMMAGGKSEMLVVMNSGNMEDSDKVRNDTFKNFPELMIMLDYLVAHDPKAQELLTSEEKK